MTEPVEWIYQAGTGCAYCKDGLCQRMNQLMEDGYSQRSAAKIMEGEAEGRWTAETIRWFFKKEVGGNQPAPNQTPTPEEQFRKKYNAFLKEVITARDSNWQGVPYNLACEFIGKLNNYI